MKATDVLMAEHRHIERVLGALETLAGEIERGGEAGPLAGFVEFFRGYADAHHHGKEEQILFPAMNRCGLSLESGPLAVMLHDHGEGRRLVGLLSDGARAEALEADGREELAGVARRYAAFLRHHIYKEDTVLFSMADTQLRRTERRQVEEQCAAYEAQRSPEAWLSLAARLERAHPACPEEKGGEEPVGHGCELLCSIAHCPVRDPFDDRPWLEG